MTTPTIHLPFATLLLLLGLLVACFWLAVVSVRGMAAALESQPDGLLPLIGSDEPQRSLLHDWDPRFKIVSILVFAFLVVSLRQPEYVVAALMVALVTVFIGRLSWARSLRRIA